MNSQPIASIDVLAAQYQHISEQLSRLLTVVERMATREEMREADGHIRDELRGLQTRIRALEDAKTATDSLVSTVKWVLTLGGAGFLAGLIKFLASSP